MKQLLIVIVSLITSPLLFAQKELPKFGNIDKADLLLKECELDKDAAAYKLIDYGDVRYVRGKDIFKIETERRIRIKILKDKGLDLANIKIKFYSKQGYENISDISAVTYNIDNSGNVVPTKLDKSSIFKKPVDKKFSEVAFTLPDVKVGSVIEYKYTDDKESIENLSDWYFQDDIPTRLSMYRILVPSIFRFVNEVMAYQKVEQSSDNVNENMSLPGGSVFSYTSDEHTYIVRNVPALTEEPYMGAAKDYLQRVVFQLSQIVYPDGEVKEIMSSWPKLTKDLLAEEDFGLQLRKNIPHTGTLDDSLKLLKTEQQKIVFIYDYVQRNMNWNGSESIYSFDGIRSAWDKKSGSNCEINFILIDLLRDAGLKAYPLLVSTKDNGSVNTLYPFLQQFNNTMACVVTENKTYILNAADKYNPAYLIPYDVVNSQAFIVDEDNGGWITLSDDKDKYMNLVSIFSEITPDGLMKGNATIYSSGYCKNPRVKKWKEDRTSFNDYFLKGFTGVKLDTLEVNNEDVDTLPLEQKLKFSLPVNSSGDYEYFPLNLFQGLEKNPFIADQRQTDIDFGYEQTFQVVGKIYIPDGYQFDELPRNIKMIMPDTSIVFTRMMQADSGSVDLRIRLDFKKPVYVAADYPLFKEFYKKLFATLNEQVVIKKKKATP
ncbi:MAG TPA: DUF3857 domain-containing protein [Ginsengibacter sp.]|nr:DUF3857 domain-containing protein [Ginsengibacter sp.]